MKKLINFLVLNLFVFIFTFITRPTMAVTLPDGYTELEYIESTGTQYIDTGILANDGTGYKITLNLPDVQTDSNQFGTRNDNGNTRFSWGVSDGKAYAGWGSNYPTYDSRPAISANVFNTASVNYLNDRTYKLNNTTAYSGLPTLEFTVANNFYLFALINAGTLYYKSYKIKEAIFTQGSSVTKHLIPAKRNSDNVIGMYDTVSNTFFTNAGTGAFVAGPEACDGTVVNYTSATGTVSQNGTPTPTNPIYPTFYTQGDMVLRRVDDYADTYDATTGKITRRVGVKVLDGTENWSLYVNRFVANTIDETAKEAGKIISSHFESVSVVRLGSGNGKLEIFQTAVPDLSTIAQFKSWLVAQKAAGTPVTVYYQLATPVEEDWTETSYCFNPIKIASTKYVETEFSALNTALANAVATVNTVVTQTIAQAASIATLQSGKQTRPADDPTDANNTENCPAGKQCLLVEGTDGKPHWYEIFDPIHRWMDAFFKVNPNGQYEENGVDFRRWQGNPDFRKTYIDGSTSVYVRQWTAATPARTVGGMYQTLPAGDLENAGSLAVEWDGTEGDIDAGAVYGIAKCTSVAGTIATKLTSAQEAKFYELPAPVGQEDNVNYPRESFKQCWCKMTAVGVPGEDGTAANGDVYPVNVASSSWVFNFTFGSAADCAYYCANSCANRVRSSASFRSAVFGM